MASSLIIVLFFIIFFVFVYYFLYKPTNKLQIITDKINSCNKKIKKQNDILPKTINSVIFSNGNPVNENINLYYDSLSENVTILYGINKKYTFNLRHDEDIATLLPILLLSK
ncbi:MV entry-fusion complex protein [Cotia virus SPAn232]|uniref:Entry-fusion complex protein OPG086 n=2 Tax=Cotia virus TaxID=39444 RepID=H6TA43_9POXV|nr:MV entry-fusion complex protein [Cotia virus SPAn232]ADT91084.1 MV entry-fusion complex protein [Cotia virus SPAn232]AIT70682.1 MV entry-fusion complex protein [Cotia virus]